MRRVFLIFTTLFVTLSALAQFAGGKGTAEDPYLIADAYQLADMQNYRSSYFKLINDIDLTEWIEDNSPNLGWSPIGTQDCPFLGDFDGNGKTISGLIINRPNQNNIGLFGYVTSGTGLSVRNVTIESPKILGAVYVGSILGCCQNNNIVKDCKLSGGKIRGNSYVGGLVGMGGQISNCHCVIESVDGKNNYVGGIAGKITNIEETSIIVTAIESAGDYVGGLSGECKSCNNCFVFALNINGESSIGGLCGTTTGVVSKCVVIANHIVANDKCGGLIGSTYSDVELCYCFANINSSGKAGGLVGDATFEVHWYQTHTSGLIKDSYFDGNIYASNLAGGIAGGNSTDRQTKVVNAYGNLLYEATFGGLTPSRCFSSSSSIISTESIAAGITTRRSVSNCVASVKLIKGGNTYRITSESNKENNIARYDTELIQDGMMLENIEDNSQNGKAVGEKTLKRSSTYVGLGWDMVNTWKINEGEDYPYLRMLADYPTVTKYETTSNCRLTGTCPVNGKIFVMKDGATYSSDIVDNAFDINVGAVNVGDTLLYFSLPEGAKPSMVRRLIVAEGTTDPFGDVIKGDANGDSVIDAADVVSTVNSILGKPSSSFNQKNADVNEDGQILVDDAVGTVNIIINVQ